jgi:hypothetical protein
MIPMPKSRSKTTTSAPGQRGFIAVLLIVMMAIGAITAWTTGLWGSNSKELERAKTRTALEQAKAAVLAYVELGNDASAANLFDSINGRLPCPNLNGNGAQDTACGTAGISRFGLVPWSTLGIEPPKDAANECLWIAVAGAFKRYGFTAATNADTNGVFTVIQPVKPSVGSTAWTERLLVGNTTTPAPAPSMAVAVIIAPGQNRAAQTRASTSTERCPLTTPASAATSAPNYLDTYTTAGGTTFDNSALTATALTPKTYVQADIDHELLNDELIWITADEFARAASRRALRVVAGAINHFVYGDSLSGAALASGYFPPPAATPGGVCQAGRLQGYVPSQCPRPPGSGLADWDAGNRLNTSMNNDPEHWLSQIHYAVSEHCIVQPPTVLAVPIQAPSPCRGGATRLTVDSNTSNVQALLLIRGRDPNPPTCATVVANGVSTPTIGPCITDAANQSRVQSVASISLPQTSVSALQYRFPVANTKNQMHLFQDRP